MKKMLFALAAAAAVCAQAAVEKVLDVRVAPQNGIVEAAGKVGKFIENPMLGALVLNGLAQQPLAEEYGAQYAPVARALGEKQAKQAARKAAKGRARKRQSPAGIGKEEVAE